MAAGLRRIIEKPCCASTIVAEFDTTRGYLSINLSPATLVSTVFPRVHGRARGSDELDIIKLDRSLIATIDSDPARRALALSLAQFATACYESGVRFAQGYLLGRPGPLLDHTYRQA